MGVDLKKTSHIVFFAAFLPAVSFGAGWAFVNIFPDLPFWVEGISPLGAYGLLFHFFDRVAWHWPIFRWFGIVSLPDLRGRWLGEQVSSYRDKNGKNRKSRVVLEVSQTFSHVRGCAYYHLWESAHTVASFLDFDGQPCFLMMFESEPKVAYDGDAAAHKGVMKLSELVPGKLEGTYFNGLGNHGELSFRRTRYTLHHTFKVPGADSEK